MLAPLCSNKFGQMVALWLNDINRIILKVWFLKYLLKSRVHILQFFFIATQSILFSTTNIFFSKLGIPPSDIGHRFSHLIWSQFLLLGKDKIFPNVAGYNFLVLPFVSRWLAVIMGQSADRWEDQWEGIVKCHFTTISEMILSDLWKQLQQLGQHLTYGIQHNNKSILTKTSSYTLYVIPLFPSLFRNIDDNFGIPTTKHAEAANRHPGFLQSRHSRQRSSK